MRVGSQTPTTSVTIPYQKTHGQKAIDLYNKTTRTAREWQEIMTYDILATNEEGLWTHSKFGYEIPRRNGKGEIIVIREIYGLMNGERILHTAHRTTTSHSAWERLCTLLDEIGIEYKATKQMGLETIRCEEENGGYVNFRTRSSKGGLGEGYDTLIIDEAQEYTIDQESALKYVVTDSTNPQTLFCGTPPTAVSAGTVFMKMRDTVMQGMSKNTGWAEWSVTQESDPQDKELWYMCNPSLGQGLSERNVEDEITSDKIDFNIQRLGLWLTYNQKSVISEKDWNNLKVDSLPKLKGKLFVGIKFGHDGENVALSIACKTTTEKIFVESIDCRKIKDGNNWILNFLARADVQKIAIDGANGQQVLADDIRDAGLRKKPILPKVADIINANQIFELSVSNKNVQHSGQPSLMQSITNCEKRPIGSKGGFGYRSIKKDVDVSLMDSIILAYWLASTTKEKKARRVSY
jgi:phage terminase large subunit-like protein